MDAVQGMVQAHTAFVDEHLEDERYIFVDLQEARSVVVGRKKTYKACVLKEW